MSDTSRPPPRLIEQPQSPLEFSLLRAGIDVRVAPATRAAVLETLGFDGQLSASSKARVVTFRRAVWLLAAMVVSAAAVAMPLIHRNMPERAVGNAGPPGKQNSDKTETLSASHVGQKSALEATLDPAAAAPPSEPSTDGQTAKPSRSTDEAGSQRSVHLPARNALAAELAALDVVRIKLNAGEPRAAQQVLDAYQRDFPKARLALEAEVLRIDALDRAGQSEAARKRAAAFIQAHPKGVLTGRVRRYLDK